MPLLSSLASVFGLGFIYFVAALPTGAALGLPMVVAMLTAWFGYSVGALVIVLIGEPLRKKLAARFRWNPNPEKPGFVLRAWKRWGLPALAVLAPVTIGPQVAVVAGLTLGVPALRLVVAVSLGVIPWCIGFGLAAYGIAGLF